MHRRFVFFSIVFLLISIIPLSTDAQEPELRFFNLSIDDELSQSIVTAIVEDSCGMMWVGTRNGLNRLIGKKVTVLRSVQGDSTSLPSDQIHHLALGPEGKIWIGTYDAGMAILDPATNKVERLCFQDQDGRDLSKSSIGRIVFTDSVVWAAAGNAGLFYVDLRSRKTGVLDLSEELGIDQLSISEVMVEGGDLWLGLNGYGLACYRPGEGVLKHLMAEDYRGYRHYNYPRVLLPAGGPWIWVGTKESYLHKVNTETGDAVIYDNKQDAVLHHATINDLLLQGKDSLWVATGVGGLQLLHIPEGRLEIVSHDKMETGIAYNTLNVLYRSRNKILWVGTNGKGLSYAHPGARRFTVYSKEKPAEYKLDFESVRSLYADEKYVFVGGYYGLNRIDRQTGIRVHWLKNIVAYSICPVAGSPNLLLIGTEGNGVHLFDKERGWIRQLRNKGAAVYGPGEFNHLNFAYTLVHQTGSLYLQGHSDGVALLDLDSGEVLQNFTHAGDPENRVAGEIKSILKDSQGRIWVGSTTGGLSRYYPEEQRFECMNEQEGMDRLECREIMDMMEDSRGNIWLGTSKGLILYDPDSGPVKRYTAEDGRLNSFVGSIEECRHGNIWCGSNEGIFRLNLSDGSIINYTDVHGLPGREMNRGASFRAENGKLFFGGVDGAISFASDPATYDFPDPQPWVVDFYIYNESVRTDSLFPYKNHLVIPKGVSHFSLAVSGMDYLLDEQNVFRYSIPGLFDDWIELGENRRIALTNIRPGSYVLKLAARSNSLDWKVNEAALHFTVEPQFIQTGLAKSLLFVLTILLIFLITLLRTRYVERQKRMLNQLVRQRTIELSASETRLKEANAAKDRFFSILAHDLKSPLSSLLSLSDIVTENWTAYSDAEKEDTVKAIRNSISITHKLLVNLLDWSRLQRGDIHPELCIVPLESLLANVLLSLDLRLKAKKIKIKNSVEKRLLAYADEKMASTVLRNLLSNATKYSLPGGTIYVRSERVASHLRIEVEDTGIGMSEETRDSLFTLTSATSMPGTEGEEGTGLGLLVCKEFVKLMNGEIGFTTKEGKGSCFWFTLPVSGKERI